MLKLLCKFIAVILILTTVVMHVNCCCASDSGIIYGEKISEISPQIIGEFSKPPKLPEPPESFKLHEKPKPPVMITKPPPSKVAQPGGFGAVFFNMLKNLGKIIILIFALAGVYLIYIKKIKRKKSFSEAEKHIEEPETISEAVFSYIQHKLKK